MAVCVTAALTHTQEYEPAPPPHCHVVICGGNAKVLSYSAVEGSEGFKLQLSELFVTKMNHKVVFCILLLQLVIVCAPAPSARHDKSKHVNKLH